LKTAPVERAADLPLPQQKIYCSQREGVMQQKKPLAMGDPIHGFTQGAFGVQLAETEGFIR
jgi:hypothetical protein